MLRETQLRRTGPSSVDCGDARPAEPARALHECTVLAFDQRRPFHVRFWKQGIDSLVAEGVALDSSGKLYVYRFDNSPCGAPGRCPPSLEETLCARPYVRDEVRGKQLACAAPPFNVPRPAVRVGGDVKPPRVIHRVEPQFESCGEVTVGGVPILEAIIDVDGTVRELRLLKPIHPCLDRTVVEALKQWRFEPGTLHGRPVPTIYNMTVHIHVQ